VILWLFGKMDKSDEKLSKSNRGHAQYPHY